METYGIVGKKTWGGALDPIGTVALIKKTSDCGWETFDAIPVPSDHEAPVAKGPDPMDPYDVANREKGSVISAIEAIQAMFAGEIVYCNGMAFSFSGAFEFHDGYAWLRTSIAAGPGEVWRASVPKRKPIGFRAALIELGSGNHIWDKSGDEWNASESSVYLNGNPIDCILPEFAPFYLEPPREK